MKPRIPYSKTDPARVTWVPAKDLYRRKIGFVQKPDADGGGWTKGDYKVWYLGSDEVQARARAMRLVELWESVEATMYVSCWTDETLPMGEAIARGQATCVVPKPWHWDDAPEQYHDLVAGYVRDLRGIDFVAADAKVLEAGKAAIQEQINGHKQQVGRLAGRLWTPIRNVAAVSPHKLHEAIDAYAAEIRKTYVTRTDRIEGSTTSPWGENFAKSVGRLKASFGDVTLDGFDLHAIEQIIGYWRVRPYRKGSQKRISVETVNDQMSSLKRFVKWLHKAKVYGWRKPEDYDDDLFRFRRQDLLTVEEKARVRTIPIWTPEELRTLWRYATTWERSLLLLGLNFGFAAAECLSLRQNEVDLVNHRVRRVRIKSGIYGEFAVWPETGRALQWLIVQAGRSGNLAHEGIILPGLDYKGITKVWKRLVARVRKDEPSFRWLLFKYLRKTAGQLVQDVSDGETMSVFHSRGKRIADEQADVYTNRDFHKVFAALAAVRARLDPMFASVEETFSGGKLLGGSNISLGTKDRIKKLWADGVKPEEIMRLAGVSRATIYRHRPGSSSTT